MGHRSVGLYQMEPELRATRLQSQKSTAVLCTLYVCYDVTKMENTVQVRHFFRRKIYKTEAFS